MAKAIIDQETFDTLPEALQSEYTQQESGGFLLNVDPVDGFALENVTGLKRTLAKTRTDLTTAKKRAEAFGDLDPQEATDALARIAEISEGGESGDDAKFKAREDQLVKRHQQELSSRDSTLTQYKSQLEKLTIDNEITKSLAEKGIKDNRVLPTFIKQFVKMEQNTDGTMRAVVLDEQGHEAIGDSKGNPMTISQYVDGLASDPQFAPFFPGTGSSGTGATGGSAANGGRNTGGAPKTISADDHKAISANIDKIASGEVVVVDSE